MSNFNWNQLLPDQYDVVEIEYTKEVNYLYAMLIIFCIAFAGIWMVILR